MLPCTYIDNIQILHLAVLYDLQTRDREGGCEEEDASWQEDWRQTLGMEQ